MNPTSTIDSQQVDTLVANSSETFFLILKIVGAILVVFLFIGLSSLIARQIKKRILKHLPSEWHGEDIANLLGDIIFYTLLIFSIFIGFSFFGFDVGIILWWVSIGIGLAFKEVLGNMIAGVMLLTTQQVNLGDVIEVQSDQDYFGTIEEITIRNTMIRTLDMRQVIIPNMTMISKPLKTFSAEEIVRLDGAIQVDYETNLHQAQEIIENAIKTIEWVTIKDQTRTAVTSFDDSGITIKYYYYFDPKAWLIGDYAKGVVNEVIKRAFDANGISIPFPHRTLVTKEWSHPIEVNKVIVQSNPS